MKQNYIESTPGPSGAKYYVVPMFPYPSGKLHMGHARNYAISDAYARHAAARGMRVMHPIGWDSFGLPAEKAAQEQGADPKAWTEDNIQQMKSQLKSMGFSFDWDCELRTHEPAYYGHTQRLFCDLMASGLVYRKSAEVWWDPVDKTVLANEQVVDGLGWRSGAPVQKIVQTMYWVKVSAYSEELAKEPLSWSKGAKADHMAWIGWTDGAAPRLRDWCVSRQRRWGTPVHAVECDACGIVPIPESGLPHVHENMGKSCPCPHCGGPAVTSCETLDTFFDSAWYFLRYPELKPPAFQGAKPFGESSRAWSPVDLYVGGREHATMHLLYARFLSRALADAGHPCPREPFKRYMSQGMVKSRAFTRQGGDGVARWVDPGQVSRSPAGGWIDVQGNPVKDEGVLKMSKSKRNGVDPTAVIAKHGVDAMRLYLFFAAPFEFDIDWDEKAVAACAKFCGRFERMAAKFAVSVATPQDEQMASGQVRFVASIDGCYERHEGLNGLVAAIMTRCNEIDPKDGEPTSQGVGCFLQVCKALHPMAPALASSCALMIDPAWMPSWTSQDFQQDPSAKRRVTLQVNGRFVDSVQMEPVQSAVEALSRAQEASEKFKKKCEEAVIDEASTVWVLGRALNAMPKRGP